MNPADPRALERLTRAVRACFRALANRGDALHADLGVTARMRAIMEHLAGQGPRTVPEIARAKAISRQAVQQTVDLLAARGLVALSRNPAHRRSMLVSLSAAGRETFATMRRREAAVFAALAEGWDPAELAAAEAVLARLTARLADPDADPEHQREET